MHEAETNEILQWYAQEDPYKKHIQQVKIRSTGTGRWLLETPEFQRWVADERQTLFCHGIPGSGKTVTTSVVIDKLLDFSKGSNIGFAFFYCDQGALQTPEQLIGSIIWQLAQRLSSIPTPLIQQYEYHKAKGTHPKASDLFEVLVSINDAFSKMYIIIDALDELPTPTRRIFFQQVFRLQIFSGKVNLFATSRLEPGIVTRFRGQPFLEIRDRSTDDDLIRYIDESIALLPAFVQEDLELQKRIKESVLEASNGMEV